MKYLKEFNTHASYEDKINIGGSDLEIPIVSYCDDVSDVHYNPYNTVEFYVGEITGTTPHTVKIYTDKTNHVDVQVSEGNKWYSYLLPKDKGLYRISGNTVTKVTVKANISYNVDSIIYYFYGMIPSSTVEASFKDSDTSNVTNMGKMFQNYNSLTSLDVSNFNTSNVTSMEGMFDGCKSLTSLDLSGWNTSDVTNIIYMFRGCSVLESLNLSGWNTINVTNTASMFDKCASLKTITMEGCSIDTINDIKAQLKSDGITAEIKQ